MRGFPVVTQEILAAEFCNEFIEIWSERYVILMNSPPHSASSEVVVVVITLFPSDATQLRSLMGQVEPGSTFIS